MQFMITEVVNGLSLTTQYIWRKLIWECACELLKWDLYRRHVIPRLQE